MADPIKHRHSSGITNLWQGWWLNLVKSTNKQTNKQNCGKRGGYFKWNHHINPSINKQTKLWQRWWPLWVKSSHQCHPNPSIPCHISGSKAVKTLKKRGLYQDIVSIIGVIRKQDILGKVSGQITSYNLLNHSHYPSSLSQLMVPS